MIFSYTKDYDQLSDLAASILLTEIKKKRDLCLCTATGNSPTGLYRNLVNAAENNPSLLEEVHFIKLDEWGGVPENHEISCERYLTKHLFNKVKTDPARYISFKSDPEDPITECRRIRTALKKTGPIDVCVLGLGKNGHIGFNEPAGFLEPYCHRALLSESSLQHEMVSTMEQKPSYGMTLGMQEILHSNKIILLITGNGKKAAFAKLCEGKVSTWLPASLLWLHPDVECIVDEQLD